MTIPTVQHWPRHVSGNGYVLRVVPGHGNADSRGRVYEHVLVASLALGKPMSSKVVIHHRNDDTKDNEPSNLVICQDQAYHKLIHERRTAYRATGNPASQKCEYCRTWGAPGDPGFYTYQRKHRNAKLAWHLPCRAAYDRFRNGKA